MSQIYVKTEVIDSGFSVASIPPTIAYQGPGDVVSGAVGWYSAARAYNAAFANGTNSIADLVATGNGAAVGTLRIANTGFVDLSAYFSGSVTPANACAAANGGSCSVTKLYDQSGNGHDLSQGTLANMPLLLFAGANSLPAIRSTGGSMALGGAANITQAQPMTFSGVYERTANFTTSGGLIGFSATVVGIGPQSTNLIYMAATSQQTVTCSDSAYHAIQGVLTGSSSLIVVDGSATSVSPGTTGVASDAIRICRFNANTATMNIMEAGLWGIAFNSGQYGNINTNQHSLANGYNF